MARFFNPFAQYFTNAGRVMPGAQLFFYVNGTTTPKTTYEDAALTTPNSNPVVCDASGRIPPIFGPDGEYYSVTLKDADDVQIDQGDDISFVDSNISSEEVLAALAANSDPVEINGSSIDLNADTDVAGDLSLTGGASRTLSLGATTSSAFAQQMQLLTSSAYNWQISNSSLAAGDLEFIPSTASGGSTFSTAALKLAGATGNSTFNGNMIPNGGSALAGSLHRSGSNLLFNLVSGAGFFFNDDTNVTSLLSIDNDTGNVAISGALSKGSGSFRIDHPLKPDTHQLVHSFTESPQADLLYSGQTGLVDGKATVNIDQVQNMTEGTFVAMCREIRVFTTNEDGWDLVRGSVDGNTLTLQSENEQCADTVSWLVIGERKDQHMFDTNWTDENGRVIVEPEKPPVPKPVQAVHRIPDLEEYNHTIPPKYVLKAKRDHEGELILEGGEPVLEKVEIAPTTTEKRLRQKAKKATRMTQESWEVIDGKAVRIPPQEEEYDEPLWLEYPKFDENGDPVFE